MATEWREQWREQWHEHWREHWREQLRVSYLSKTIRFSRTLPIFMISAKLNELLFHTPIILSGFPKIEKQGRIHDSISHGHGQ